VSDAERRRSEREWLLGDPAAGLRDLIERQRAGDMDRPRLLLLSYLDYGPARRLLGADALDPEPRLFPWLRGLAAASAWPPELGRRAAGLAGLAGVLTVQPRLSPERARAAAALIEYGRAMAAGSEVSLWPDGLELMAGSALSAKELLPAIDMACAALDHAAAILSEAGVAAPRHKLMACVRRELIAWLLD